MSAHPDCVDCGEPLTSCTDGRCRECLLQYFAGSITEESIHALVAEREKIAHLRVIGTAAKAWCEKNKQARIAGCELDRAEEEMRKNVDDGAFAESFNRARIAWNAAIAALNDAEEALAETVEKATCDGAFEKEVG